MRWTLGIVAVMAALLATSAFSQFKEKAEARPSVSESMVRADDSGLMFGWFDPNRLTMHHTYSLSYQSLGGKGLSLGVYTNSLMYKFSELLDFQADISLMHSPFNSFGDKMRNDLSGIFLSRAQLNYRPSDNMLFQIQFRQLPPLYWLGGYGYRSSNFFDGVNRYEEDRP